MKILTTGVYLDQPRFKTEDHFTSTTNMFISHNYESLRGFYYHIPNESESNRHRVKGLFTDADKHRLKLFAMGVMPGVPDFCFTLPYHWYMELKLPDGVLSPAQKSLHARWKDKRIIIHTCYDPKQVVECMNAMVGKPMFP